MRHAVEAGATQDEIAETIGLMAMFAGLPAMSRAMEMARDVMNTTQARDGDT